MISSLLPSPHLSISTQSLIRKEKSWRHEEEEEVEEVEEWAEAWYDLKEQALEMFWTDMFKWGEKSDVVHTGGV